MLLTRRQFIKSVLAAAVVAQIPFTEAEAAEAYEHIGMDNCGNGWWRCWVIDGDESFSTFAKAGQSSRIALRYRRIHASFDLSTGTVDKISVMEKAVVPPRLETEADCLQWGAQVESGTDVIRVKSYPYRMTDEELIALSRGE